MIEEKYQGSVHQQEEMMKYDESEMRYTEDTRKFHLSRTEEVDQCEKQLKETARRVVEHVDRTSKSVIAVLTGSGGRSVNEDNFLDQAIEVVRDIEH